MKLSPGTIIGRYTVEEMVGEGGMATVYRVRHNELHATYALKVLHMVSDAIQRRLVQEGRVQARLRHPNILPVTDILDIEGRPGLIMEYVEGPSLEIHLATRHLSLEEADHLARGILSAVAFAHSQGCVHRDLKPANILVVDIAGEFIPKVADFGLVKVIDEENDSLHKTRSGIGIGTPCYMAPEQALDAAHVDERADVFSLGAILYELVCGRRAFHGPNAVAIILRIAAGLFTPPEELRSDLPKRMLNAIHGAMQIDRSHRIQDCQTLREVWRGARRWQAPAVAKPDATWSDEDVLTASDGGLSDLQDIIRSIAGTPSAEFPKPDRAPIQVSPIPPVLGSPALASPSVAHATAVPLEPDPGPPPRLPTMNLGPMLASTPDPEARAEDGGTLADDLALEMDVGIESVSDALQSADPAKPPQPPALPEPAPTAPEPTGFEQVVASYEPAHIDEDEEERRGLGLLPKLMVAVGLLLALGLGGAVVAGLAVSLRPQDDGIEQPDAEDTLPSLSGVLPEPEASPAEQPEVVQPAVEAHAEVSEAKPGTSPLVHEPKPAAAPEPETAKVKAAPTPLRMGTVAVTGDMVSAVLISQSGRRRSPGEVPVGTYDLEVSFANGKIVTRSDMVEVTSGSSTSIRCSSRVENCR
jgi:eukaryotic-like serine/threonine-protein kinase